MLNQQVGGSVTASGSWRLPQLQARFGQPSNPLLGRWDAVLDWRDKRLVLQRFSSAHLSARGVLPLGLRSGEGLVPGQLDLNLELQRYPSSGSICLWAPNCRESCRPLAGFGALSKP